MQKTLTLSDQEARKLFPFATPEFKALLESNWGKDFFHQDIMERVKTLEDVCRETGTDFTAFMLLKNSLAPDTFAYETMKLISKALNEGWVPDWNDGTAKWQPWFYLDGPSGFRFYDSFCDYSNSVVGSRLVFKSEKLSNYAAKQFLDVYKAFFTEQ